jgi:hypothetical protein
MPVPPLSIFKLLSCDTLQFIHFIITISYNTFISFFKIKGQASIPIFIYLTLLVYTRQSIGTGTLTFSLKTLSSNRFPIALHHKRSNLLHNHYNASKCCTDHIQHNHLLWVCCLLYLFQIETKPLHCLPYPPPKFLLAIPYLFSLNVAHIYWTTKH